MSQASSRLRRAEGAFEHWCPACEQMHTLPDSWTFDGDLESPTFHPSFKHSGILRDFVDGKWTGTWKRDAGGNTIRFVCHYNLVAGKLQFAVRQHTRISRKDRPVAGIAAGVYRCADRRNAMKRLFRNLRCLLFHPWTHRSLGIDVAGYPEMVSCETCDESWIAPSVPY